MKIAVVNVVGMEGSTGKIATNLSDIYKKWGYYCRIYHGRGERQKDGTYHKYGSYPDNVMHYLMERVTDKEGEYSSAYTRHMLADMKSYDPDMVVLLNLHGHYLNIPMFMNELSSMKARVVYFMCDEFPYTARCTYPEENCEGFISGCNECPLGYRNLGTQYEKKKSYYDAFGERIAFASVGFIVERARRSALLQGRRIYTVNAGIDTEFYHPVDTLTLRQHLGIDSEKIILINVAPYSNERKGVRYFLEAARALEGCPKYVFVNVGYDGRNERGLPSNFIGIPYVSDQESLRMYYSVADAYICTSQADALPNACVSAMSCGTPIVGFPISGIPYLAEEPMLHLLGNVSSKAIVEYVETMEKKTNKLTELCRNYAVENYSFINFAEKIYALAGEK